MYDYKKKILFGHTHTIDIEFKVYMMHEAHFVFFFSLTLGSLRLKFWVLQHFCDLGSLINEC